MSRSGSSSAFRARCEAGDLLLLLYLIALARQYFWWGVHSNPLAWSFAIVLGAIVWWKYVATKVELREPISLPFVLLVVVPLSFAYGLRAPLPDVSFDVLNYRLLHAERSLRGFVYQPGDFFPTLAPFNPAPDTVTGLARYVFGYRLGTIVNLCALLWTGRILERWLRAPIASAWLRAVSVLAILAAEHLFFEINTYMVDLLSVPLLIEAARLALRPVSAGQVIRVAFLLGLAVAFKIANLIALPIALLCIWRFVTEHRSAQPITDFARVCIFAAVAFLAPLLPFSIYACAQTGSPVFPMANSVFKSPLWPENNNARDPRWGPNNAREAFAWPVQMFFAPERISELSLYSGRLSLGVIASVAALIFAWRAKELRRLSFLLLAISILWCATTGYIRYALELEVLAGLLLVLVAVHVLRQPRLQVFAMVLLCSLGAQSLLAGRYVALTEWSRRTTFFQRSSVWLYEAHYLLRDRSLRAFAKKKRRQQFRDVQVWVNSSMKTSGLEVLLNKTAPLIGLRTEEVFTTKAGQTVFAQALKNVAGKRMFTLAFADDVPAALVCLTSHGLVAGSETPVSLSFFSPGNRLPLVLIEVIDPQQPR